jgi:hypothetical protein
MKAHKGNGIKLHAFVTAVGTGWSGQDHTANSLPSKIRGFRSGVGSRDSSVGTALGYGLEDRGSRVRFPVGAGNLYLHYRVQNGSGAHPAFYPMGTRGSFPGGKAAGA